VLVKYAGVTHVSLRKSLPALRVPNRFLMSRKAFIHADNKKRVPKGGLEK